MFALTLAECLRTILAHGLLALGPRIRVLAQALVLIPWAIPPVIQGLMWRWLLNGEAGPVGDVLLRLGLVETAPLFLADPLLAQVSLVAVFSWRGASITSFFVLAGLTSVPKEVVDSARIDGAGPLRRFFGVTLPIMAPVMLVALVYRAMDAVRVFDIVQSLTAGGPGTTTETISSFAYQTYFRYSQYGLAGVYSMVLFAITITLGLPLVLASQRRRLGW